MARSKLCVRTDATHPRPHPARGPSGGDGSLFRLRQQFYCCCLIYKFAHFKEGMRLCPLNLIQSPRRNLGAPVSWGREGVQQQRGLGRHLPLAVFYCAVHLALGIPPGNGFAFIVELFALGQADG